MDPKIPPKAMTDPTQDDPSSSIPNPVELLLSWRLAALVQPVKLPQLNIPMETERLALGKVPLLLLIDLVKALSDVNATLDGSTYPRWKMGHFSQPNFFLLIIAQHIISGTRAASYNVMKPHYIIL